MTPNGFGAAGGRVKARRRGRASLRPSAFLLHPSDRGHTLTELLVVMMILVLFAVIAAPRFIGSIQKTRLDNAFTAARSDLIYARDRAIATGLRHQFELEPSTGEIAVEPAHPEDATATSAAGQQIDVALHDRIPDVARVAEWNVSPLAPVGANGQVAASAQAGPQPLVFYPEGNGDGARLILEDSQRYRRGLLVDGFSGEIREMTQEELGR